MLRSASPRSRLEEILIARGLKQAELSRISGVDKSDVNRAVLDKRPLTMRQRKLLATALKCSEDNFDMPIGAPIVVDNDIRDIRRSPDGGDAETGKLLVTLRHVLLADVDNYRFANHFPSRSAAISELLEFALSVKKGAR